MPTLSQPFVHHTVLFFALLALASGCGSDEDEGAGTTDTGVTAAEVESALMTRLSSGGSGVVQLDVEAPKQVTCVKDAGSPSGWRCTVTPAKGRESYLCLIEVDPQTKQVTKTSCGRIDN
jgi:hypothetical protein